MAQQKDVTNSQAIVKSFKIYHNTVKDFKSARESDAFIDIVDIYNSFSIHETILNPFITATVNVSDTNNILTEMPIIGGEIVRVRFLPPGGDDTDERDLVFRIAKISNVTIVEKRQHFNLHLLSYAGFKNITTRISRAFKGDATTIVDDIYYNYLFTKMDTSATKDLNFDNSLSTLKFICPNWSPAKAIQYAMRYAYTRDKGVNLPNFFFYETLNDFYFLNTNTLFDREKNVCVTDKYDEILNLRPEGKIAKGYHYKQPGIPVVGADGLPRSNLVGDESYQNVDEFMIDDENTFAEDYMSGNITTSNTTHDIFHKSYSTQSFNYYDDFDKFPRLGNNQKYVRYNDMGESLNINKSFTPKHSRNHSNLVNQTGERATYSDTVVLNRSQIVKQMFEEVITNFEVPGHTLINAGKLVDFNFPSAREINNLAKAYDKHRKGLYLIRDCIHKIVNQGAGKAIYKCNMNIVKDGYHDVE